MFFSNFKYKIDFKFDDEMRVIVMGTLLRQHLNQKPSIFKSIHVEPYYLSIIVLIKNIF